MHRLLILMIVISCSCTHSVNKVNEEIENHNDTLDISSLANKQKDTLTKCLVENDTIFIKREIILNHYHAIYIEKNKQTIFYKKLLNFEFCNEDIKAFIGNWNYTNQSKSRYLKRNEQFDLPKEWIPLNKFNGNYYLYAPSDWGNAGKRIILDTAFVYWHMDGPNPVPLIKTEKVSNNKYVLTITNLYNPNSDPAELIIYIIDNETKMSVWEFSNLQDRFRYQLYVPKINATKFDMVVNYSKNQKHSEYNFDEIDYKELIKAANTQ